MNIGSEKQRDHDEKVVEIEMRTFLTSALDMPEIMSYIYSKSWNTDPDKHCYNRHNFKNQKLLMHRQCTAIPSETRYDIVFFIFQKRE